VDRGCYPIRTLAPRTRHLWKASTVVLLQSGVAMASLTTSLSGQAVTELVTTLRQDCTVLLDTVAAIRRNGPVRLSDQAILSVLPSGSIFVLDPVTQPGRLLEYASNGEYSRVIDVSEISQPGFPIVGRDYSLLLPDERTGVLRVIAGGRVAGDPIRTVAATACQRGGKGKDISIKLPLGQ
jgi:hypothetical protein